MMAPRLDDAVALIGRGSGTDADAGPVTGPLE